MNNRLLILLLFVSFFCTAQERVKFSNENEAKAFVVQMDSIKGYPNSKGTLTYDVPIELKVKTTILGIVWWVEKWTVYLEPKDYKYINKKDLVEFKIEE